MSLSSLMIASKPCLKPSYLFEIEDHPVGCVKAKGLVHSLAHFVLQENVRGKFGAAHAFGPVFNGTAKKASKSTFSILWLYIKFLEKSYRRGVAAIHIVSTQVASAKATTVSLALQRDR